MNTTNNWANLPFAYLDSAFSRTPGKAASFADLMNLAPINDLSYLSGDALKSRKAGCPAFFPHAMFADGRKASDAQEHTGLVQIDFDHVSDVDSLKATLSALPWVAFASVSISGSGVFALVYTGKVHELALVDSVLDAVELATGCEADRMNSKSVAALRFLGADNAPYFCANPEAFEA
tara:strand:+ start:94 stop:627 length:534 start_codon:yes stop_codon:yes gene_type:complete